MGANADAARLGFPYRPTPAGLATTLWDFDPRTSGDGAMPDIPDPPDFTIANWEIATDNDTTFDFPDMFSTLFPRVWGYVGSIDETTFWTT